MIPKVFISMGVTAILSALVFAGVTSCTHAPKETDSLCPTADVVEVETHGGTKMKFTWTLPKKELASSIPVAFVLLPGGGGHIKLNREGCPTALAGNSLIRSQHLFQREGFATALVDAPSDHQGEDGLAGFRASVQHADDIGKIIGEIRSRFSGAVVWVVGTSRGAISAVNAASRLRGSNAPDGLIVTSALMVGQASPKRPWLDQTVFGFDLGSVRIPTLIIGHTEDKCIRSPAAQMVHFIDKVSSHRKQVVTVKGGSGGSKKSGIDACEGRSAHGFFGQEAEVASGIARFVRGQAY